VKAIVSPPFSSPLYVVLYIAYQIPADAVGDTIYAKAIFTRMEGSIKITEVIKR